MKSGIKIVLWIAVTLFAILAVYMLTEGFGTSHSDAAGRGLSQAVGLLVGLIAAGAAVALVLGQRWRGWLIIAALILVLPFLLVAALSIAKMFEEAHNQQYTADLHSGREDFRDQPALLAVAEAISRNDEAAIRAAAKNVPNLQAAGQDGKTLLYFAVDEALQRPELVRAVEVLLSLGADPNYNNGQLASFAMWRGSNGEVRLLRALLDAGGNPNASDFRGTPIIFGLWDLAYFEADRQARLRLLLDRGADINSTEPDKSPLFPGYSLLMFRARMGKFEPAAYADALDLLGRGADFNHVAQDGVTLVKLLIEDMQWFSEHSEEAPAGYQALWDWLKAHGVEQ